MLIKKNNNKNKKLKMGNKDKLFYGLNDLLLLLFFIIVLFPLIHVISASFSSPDAVAAGHVKFLPVGFSLAGYKEVLNYKPVWTGYRNSLFYATAGTFINLVFTILAAYPLSRKDLKGRKIITILITFTMIFNGGLIPTYIIMQKLGFVNTPWAMLLPNAILVYNFIITKSYFENNISEELLDASKIDGCSDVKFLLKIVLPLSKSIIAVIGLYYGVFHWNAFFQAMIYLRDEALFPLQLFLRDILVLNEVSLEMMSDLELMAKMENMRDLLKYSVIIVASIPVLMVYPFIQKYFVKGQMEGAVKG
ncbi:MAG: carbohydrate ABC transporter permease [Vallitalea sp.]|jgi:multiple sugar transport system permease protein/putative aldouronate transport system permease protein|nr:carbohydrate ABC transporter permease [Vallitalea sp.]